MSNGQQQLTGIAPQREAHNLSVACVSIQVFASRLLNAPIILTCAFVRIGFATKCATGGDGWGELVGVWGRGLLARKVNDLFLGSVFFYFLVLPSSLGIKADSTALYVIKRCHDKLEREKIVSFGFCYGGLRDHLINFEPKQC